MRNRLPIVYESSLEYIIDSPNFFNIERFLARGNRPGAQLSGYFGIVVALLCLFVPIFFVVGLLYVSFRDAMSTNDYPIWGWVFVVIPAIIATRALTMVIYLLIDEIR
jgi:hypothetical protein